MRLAERTLLWLATLLRIELSSDFLARLISDCVKP